MPARGESVQWREFGSDAILLDPVTGQFAQVNTPGLAIWDSIDGQRTVAEIAQHLATEFETTPDDLVMDIQAFIEELIDKRLLTLAP